jgi:putative ABC transport system ATP-binding protein
MSFLIKTIDLYKSFPLGDQHVEVLRGVNLEIVEGEFAIIFGPSGCGKSTLLHTILGLEPPTKGEILVEGKDFYSLTQDERSLYRKRKMGTIFQQPIWIRSLSVIRNVAFPLRLLGYEEKEALEKARSVLRGVGMENWANYLPTELSAGQQQKVSLARALMADPVFLAADEPTGNLDTFSGQELMEDLLALNKKGKTILMITHDLEYLRYAGRIFHMVDGQIVEERRRDNGKKSPMLNDKKLGKRSRMIDVRDPTFLSKMKF